MGQKRIESDTRTKGMNKQLNKPENANITWRVAMDGFACAIEDCDPMASGWMSLCGKFVTGPEDNELHQCQKCAATLRGH